MASKNYKTGIIITGDASGGVKAARLTSKELGKLSAQKRRNTTRARDLSRQMKKTGKSFLSFRGVVAGVTAVLGAMGGRALINSFKEQEQSVAALDASINSMGRTTVGLSKNLQTLASQIQGEGIIGDEALIKGQSFLTTYGAITDELLPRTTRIMADLTAKMGGDTVRAANLLGKASMGMTGELSRLGITLSEESKKSKDFALILSDIESQVQGMNKALAATDTGQLDQLGNTMGDLKEAGGKHFAAFFAQFSKGWQGMAETASRWLNSTVDSTRHFAVSVGAYFDRAGFAMRPLVTLLGDLAHLGKTSFDVVGDYWAKLLRLVGQPVDPGQNGIIYALKGTIANIKFVGRSIYDLHTNLTASVGIMLGELHKFGAATVASTQTLWSGITTTIQVLWLKSKQVIATAANFLIEKVQWVIDGLASAANKLGFDGLAQKISSASGALNGMKADEEALGRKIDEVKQLNEQRIKTYQQIEQRSKAAAQAGIDGALADRDATLKAAAAKKELIDAQERERHVMIDLNALFAESNDELFGFAKAQQFSASASNVAADAVENLAAGTAKASGQIQTITAQASPFAKTWEQAVERVDNAFFGLWKSGLDSFDDFKTSLKDGFKTLIAQLIHQATTQKIILSFGASMGLGGSGLASASGAGSGGIGGAGGMVSTAKSAYSFLSGGLDAAQGFAATGIDGIGNMLHQMGFESLADNVVNAGFENLVNASAAQLGLSLVGGIAGSYAGNKLGESVFGKQAESNWGATILGAVGSIWGPVGAFVGATVGSMLDVAFGGDGKKRVKLGVGTGSDLFNGGSVIDSMTADSGLELTALAKRVGDGTNGQSAVDLMNAFGGIDAALTGSTRGAGFAVDLSGVSLAGRGTQGEGKGPAAGFGSFGFNGLDGDALENAPTEFIAAWIAQVASAFDDELRGVVTGLTGSTEQMLSDYQVALGLDQLFDGGGRVFDDIDNLAETFGLLQGEFRKTDESVADTIARLDMASALMGAIGGETAHTVVALSAAQTQLDAVGTETALQIIGISNQLSTLKTALDADHVEQYRRSQESLWQLWERQSDGVAALADNASTVDIELLTAAVGEFGRTTMQVVGQIFQAKDSIAGSFGSLINQIQMDLLGSDQARYAALKGQADALAESISMLTDPSAIIAAASQVEQLTSSAYGLLGEQQQQMMGEGIIAFLDGVNASAQAQLDAALETVQTQQDPDAPGSTANAVQVSFERMTDVLVERVNAATEKHEAAAARMEAAAAQQQNAASSFGGWVGGLPSSFNVNVTVPEVG